MVKKKRNCVVAPTAQIGHNGGPDMEAERLFAIIGPRTDTLVEPFQLGAPWTGHATDEELKRLGVLQRRIEMRKRIIKEATTERQKIMNRCIRRMRREQGKS